MNPRTITVHMEELPFELIVIILSQFSGEEQQLFREVSASFASLIEPRVSNFIKIGAMRGVWSYCERGYGLGHPEEGMDVVAAKYGQTEILRKFIGNGGVLNQHLCQVAAEGRHLETLKFVHANGCHLFTTTYSRAARGGSVEVLKYLHANECPRNDDTILGHALSSGSPEAFTWVLMMQQPEIYCVEDMLILS
jgi:hypothetical protein